MKIWGAKAGGNPVRVAIFLAEKGIDIPFEPVDLLSGEHRTEAFRAKNPSALVPVLELDDGTCLSETMAICRYFEGLQPEPPLMGVGVLDQAIVEMWQRRVEYQVYGVAREVFRHSVPFVKALEPIQVAEWAEVNRPRVTKGLEMLDAQLQSQPYIAGPRFTVADITAIFSFQMLPRIGVDMPPGAKALARWHAEVRQRPSVVSVLGPPED
jgi:glutathione S-transferase